MVRVCVCVAASLHKKYVTYQRFLLVDACVGASNYAFIYH